MKILATFPVEEIIEHCHNTRHQKRRSVRVLGRKFNIDNFKVFSIHGCTCARCGIQGDRVIAWQDKGGTLHMDLFAMKDNKLMMMNRDHIQPKSKNGTNNWWNFQTMCQYCNSKKGNVMSEHEQQLLEFRKRWNEVYTFLNRFIGRYFPLAVSYLVPPTVREPVTSWASLHDWRYKNLHRVSYGIAKVMHVLA